jgi:hypothetical protein
VKTVFFAAILVAAVACDPGSDVVVVDEERPCAFATGREVAAAVEGRAGAARAVEAIGKDGTLLCTYDVDAPYSTVTLHVETDVSEKEFRARMERDPLNTDPLEGPGDIAFTHGGVGVSVWEDGDAVSASLQHFGDPAVTHNAVRELGELIAAKL